MIFATALAPTTSPDNRITPEKWRLPMRKMMLRTIAVGVAMLFASTLYAQDISGDWQATLKAGPGIRLVLHITKSDSGGWNAILYNIDQGLEGIPVTSITLQDSTLKYSVDRMRATYEGKLNAGGASITGIWTQPNGPKPLDFQRATKETAWPLPDPNWGHKPVKVDPKIFDGYVGRYQFAPDFVLKIVREADHLFPQAPRHPPFELYPVSEKEYFARIAKVEFSFHTDDHGAVTEMVVHQN